MLHTSYLQELASLVADFCCIWGSVVLGVSSSQHLDFRRIPGESTASCYTDTDTVYTSKREFCDQTTVLVTYSKERS